MSHDLALQSAQGANIRTTDGQVDQRERRSEGRVYTVFRVGKLILNDQEHLCRIRNISTRGIMADSACPLEKQQVVSVELRDGDRLDGVVAWVSKHSFGVTFAKRINIKRALTKDVGGTRPARIKTRCSAKIRIGAIYRYAELEDISQKGCRLKVAENLLSGQEVVISIEGFPPIKGVVRWFRNGETGIEFNEALCYAALENWLWMHRNQPDC